MRRALVAFVLAGAAAFAAPSLAQDQKIPFKREAEAVDAGMLLRVAIAFGVVLAIGVGGIFVLKRYLPGSLGRATTGAGRINIVEIRRVTPRLSLLLVEVDGEKVLLAQSGDRVHTVHLPKPRA